MKLAPTAQTLYDAISEFEIIDAHEHLPPEKDRLARTQDVFTLFSHYTRVDLLACGMTLDTYNNHIQNSDIPVEERWRTFGPYLPRIRYGSYARPAFIAAREFYGADDITPENYRELSERIQAENTPGIYQRILSDKCRVKVALTQCGHTRLKDDPLLVPLMNFHLLTHVENRNDIDQRAEAAGRSVKNLEDYEEVMREQMQRWKAEGAVGLKMTALVFSNPSREAAEAAFTKISEGQKSEHLTRTLRDYLVEILVEMAAEQDWPVAVHAGMWGDFREMDAQNFIPFAPRHPNVTFDLYHMSMPNVRPCAILAKNFANVHLNLCWTHVISQKMTIAALDEYLDLLPISKITAFGGDYNRPVEKVYGHLVMAREDIATVLGRRVDEGFFGPDEAAHIAHQWFYENPKRIYKLDV